MTPKDIWHRPLESLRLSVTDRCNLRCFYCMPEHSYHWLPREDVLSFEEISSLVDCFCALGVTRLRLTGGEPLLRQDLERLVAMLSQKPAIQDLAMTTNGVLLEERLDDLLAAGLGRVTISLDTLKRDRFSKLTRRDDLPRVLRAIEAVAQRGVKDLKIDTVVMRGVNEDELTDLIEFGRSVNAEVRFIEYMDVGGATQWGWDQVVTREEILTHLSENYPEIDEIPRSSPAPAERFQLERGDTFGIISSMSQPFCTTCNRSRLTADGMWFRCLYAKAGTDLRGPLRSGVSLAEIQAQLEETWRVRDDRGAMDRAQSPESVEKLTLQDLQRDPHLEMHKRGG